MSYLRKERENVRSLLYTRETSIRRVYRSLQCWLASQVAAESQRSWSHGGHADCIARCKILARDAEKSSGPTLKPARQPTLQRKVVADLASPAEDFVSPMENWKRK